MCALLSIDAHRSVLMYEQEWMGGCTGGEVSFVEAHSVQRNEGGNACVPSTGSGPRAALLTLLPPRSLKGKGLAGTIPSPGGWELPPRLQRLQLSSSNISGEARARRLESFVERKQLHVRRQPAIAATRPAASRRQLGANPPPGWTRAPPTQVPSLQTGRCRPAWR